MENDPDAEFYIPLIWQGDGAWPSPGYSTRGTLYGVGGIPHAQWGGFQEIVGGGGSTMYNSYINMYNQLVDDVSPVEMLVGLGFDNNGDLLVQANVELTGDITTTNNKIVYIIKWHQNAEYFCTVVGYANEDFSLTSTGETGTYSYSFPMNAAWEIEDLTAVAMVQTYSGNHAILQAGQAQLTGLVAAIGSNVQSGPPSLAVDFTSVSYPLTGIESWEWDVDGDGVYDYTEENPTHMYDTPGSYDVTLRIGMEGEYNEVTIPGYITVTEDAVAEGVVSGVWHSDLGPYLATGDLLVKPGNLLVIEPGTEIILEDGAEFLVKGQLIADARDSEMIVFRTESEWTGIHIKDSMEENIIAWCEVTGATASAIYIENSDCTIMDNLIHHNSGSALGAAIELLDVMDIEIAGNLIANNTSSGLTGGISMTNCFPSIHNNVVVNNTAGTAGAFSIKQNSAPVIVNNTIANNVGVNGAFLLFNSQPTLVNCIVQSEGNVFAAIASTPTVMYSCLSGGYTGEGNIDVDPMFIAPSEGYGSEFDGMTANWQLLAGSECIDAGDPNVIYNDLDDTRNDMGAFGWNGFPDYGLTDTDPETIVPAPLEIIAYPNPFNPSTNLSFNLSEAANVSLEVYNIKGQMIETLADRHFDAGNHQITWNADNFASGVYFLKLSSGSENRFQKLILMK
ncbi:MAG: T9SS type A sorting domain-containing protein [Candidatus Cloacimonetes bacterium]|nr:T9SS type A sorting domain-containing protein [Candidatus Cloacimonadota bacterium]